jgi:uncharacterized protein YecE (DUF72 family)
MRPALKWWWQQMQPALENVDRVYGFFNNDYAGHSPASCNQFKDIVGLPTKTPRIPKQQSLF